MPNKLVPHFRFLNPSVPLTHFLPMNLKTSIRPSGVSPIFSRVFPFKLRYLGLSGPRAFHHKEPGFRQFSTRPFRRRTGSVSGSNKFPARESFGASKSLVEDEAELSDWVSELRTDSFRGRVTSEEESDEDRSRPRGRFRDRDMDRELMSTKRRRENDLDEFRDSNSRRTRGPVESNSKKSRGVSRFGSGSENNYDGDALASRRKNSGSRGERGGPVMGKRGGREMKSAQGWVGEGLRRGEKVVKKEVNFVSDSEEEDGEELIGGIRDLLKEEESDGEDSANDDDLLRKKSASSLFSSENEMGVEGSPRSSPGTSDSYLSETRYAKGCL